MEAQALIVEQIYNATIEEVWDAITDKEKMKKWYFDLKEFKPEVGFEFQFYGGSEEKQYLHLCKITEVIPGKKISYTWKYEGYPGESTVSFELFPEGNQTRLKLVHTGLETFTIDSPDFARTSFETGWKYITGTSLKEYLENN